MVVCGGSVCLHMGVAEELQDRGGARQGPGSGGPMWRVGGLVVTAAAAVAGEEEVVCVFYRMTQQLLSPVFSLFL